MDAEQQGRNQEANVMNLETGEIHETAGIAAREPGERKDLSRGSLRRNRTQMDANHGLRALVANLNFH
jgi:hypothetical protein